MLVTLEDGGRSSSEQVLNRSPVMAGFALGDPTSDVQVGERLVGGSHV